MLIYLNKKAQSTAEYVIILGLVIGTVIAIQTYVKRGLQGRIRDATEHVEGEETLKSSTFVRPEGGDFSGKQYEPYYLTSEFESTRGESETETMSTVEGGKIARTGVSETSSRSGTQWIGEAE